MHRATVVGRVRPPPDTPRYDAAIASGQLGLINNDSLLVALSGFERARQRHQVLVDLYRETFFVGALRDLRADIGTLSVLNPVGGRADPPERLRPADLNELIQRREVYSAVEPMHVVRVNVTTTSRQMERIARSVLSQLRALLS